MSEKSAKSKGFGKWFMSFVKNIICMDSEATRDNGSKPSTFQPRDQPASDPPAEMQPDASVRSQNPAEVFGLQPGPEVILSPLLPRSGAQLGWSFTKSLLKLVAEISELNPVKAGFMLAKKVIELQEASLSYLRRLMRETDVEWQTVKENMDNTERHISSIIVQLDSLQMTLEGWVRCEGPEKRAVECFESVLGTEFSRLVTLSREPSWMRAVDHENEKRQIADVFERVNEARLRLGLEANLRTMRVVSPLNKHLRDSLFDRLKPSDLADYTYELEGPQKKKLRREVCTPGTRAALQKEIVDWAKHGAEQIYWLSGPAGTGKTTVAYTLARRFELATPDDVTLLGANFFCSRHYDETRFATRVVRTIAYQLALRFTPFADALEEVGEWTSATKGVQTQLDDLFIKPWNRVLQMDARMPNARQEHLIILDALDEFEDKGGTHFLHILLSNIMNGGLRGLKFFITSRPDPELTRHLASFESRKTFRLQDITADVAHADIEVYLNDSLPHLVGQPQLKQLVQLTDGLFICAATITNHLLPLTPREQMKFLTDLCARQSSALSPKATRILDELYYQVLSEAFSKFEIGSPEHTDRLRIIHTFLCAHEPISPALAAALLFEDEYTNTHPLLSCVPMADAITQSLHAVLYLQDGKVFSYHNTFVDFMFDKARSREFACIAPVHHRRLTGACFRVMTIALQSSITEAVPLIPNADDPHVESETHRHIPPALQYSCLHWDFHLSSASHSLPDAPDPLCNLLVAFLSLPALFWMEATSLIESPTTCVSMLRVAYKFVQQFIHVPTLQFVEAIGFATHLAGTQRVSSVEPLYISALTTWPRNRLPCSMWRTHFPHVPRHSSRHGYLIPLSTSSLERRVSCIDISPDGHRVVAGTEDGEVLLLDGALGEILWASGGESAPIRAVSFLEDGLRVVSSSSEGSVAFWNTTTGQRLHTRRLGRSERLVVAVSGDGSWVLVASWDGVSSVVWIWDVTQGAMEDVLQEHSPVLATAFSPDGGSAALLTEAGSLLMWDVPAKKVASTARVNLHRGSVGIASAAISGKMAYLAIGYADGTVRLWDIEKDAHIVDLNPDHLHASLSFSPDESAVTVVHNELGLSVWDTKTGGRIRSLSPVESHPYVEGFTAKLSKDGGQLASCSGGELCVWLIAEDRDQPYK